MGHGSHGWEEEDDEDACDDDAMVDEDYAAEHNYRMYSPEDHGTLRIEYATCT
jgi:hypothetical protein